MSSKPPGRRKAKPGSRPAPKPKAKPKAKPKPRAKAKPKPKAGPRAAPQRQRARTRPRPQKRVVLLFVEGLELPYDDSVEQALLAQQLGSVEDLRLELPVLRWAPPPDSRPSADVRRLLEGADRRHPGRPPSRLMSLYAADAQPGTDFAALAAAFGEWDSVERAYVQAAPTRSPADVTRDNEDPDGPDQHHLDDADATDTGPGIGARWAWSLPGGDGDDVGFGDVEKGWHKGHDDLTGHTFVGPITGSEDEVAHGTRVLGVVAARDNDKLCVGIAPRLVSITLASRIFTLNFGTYVLEFDQTANAITAMLAELLPGDVLLLETQTTVESPALKEKVPSEIELAVCMAIQEATGKFDLIVVAAAGNGGHDLDLLFDDTGEAPLSAAALADDPTLDSGSILVGSANVPDLDRRLNSCYGARVHCFSWGQSVVTLSTDDDKTVDDETTKNFEDTSSAAAIVAGVAAVVQSIHKSVNGMPLDPGYMRNLLSQPALNTPSKLGALLDKIGFQPDLKRILRDGLGIAPDTYLRDHVGDDGSPHNDSISASPDVILRQAAVADPDAAFGEASGTADVATLGEPAIAGGTHVIYVRARNRGALTTEGMQAKLHWTPPATLAMPFLWTEIGTTAPVDVPPGDQLTVLPGLNWINAPDPGHYCFIAELDDPWDSAPLAETLTTLPAFKEYVRRYNNITWRNFNVVGPPVPGAPLPSAFGGAGGLGGPAFGPAAHKHVWKLPFLAVGGPGRADTMRLEFLGNLPANIKVAVDVPLALHQKLHRAPDSTRPDDLIHAASRRVLMFVPSAGTHLVLEGEWPARQSHACQLVLMPDPRTSVGTHEVAMRQVFENVEVGRVTWLTQPTLDV